jgi:hypothetical protein
MAPQDKIRQLSEDGWCVIPGVLTPQEAAEARKRLWAAAEESERRDAPTRSSACGRSRPR